MTFCICDGRTECCRESALLDLRSCCEGGSSGKSGSHKPEQSENPAATAKGNSLEHASKKSL